MVRGLRPIPPDRRERRRRSWLNRGRPRPSKRIRSRGLAERLDQAKRKAEQQAERQRERERRRQQREQSRLLRLRLGTRRGVGSQLYTRDEREEEEDQPKRKRKHQAGSFSSMTGGTAAMAGMTALKKGRRKMLKKLTRVG